MLAKPRYITRFNAFSMYKKREFVHLRMPLRSRVRAVISGQKLVERSPFIGVGLFR
jgi:hypothetical protein